MHSSWTYQCVPFILLTAKSVDFAVVCDGFPSKQKLSVFFVVATLIAAVIFEQFMIRTAV